MGLIVALSVIGGLLFLAFDFLIAKEFQNIARQKGYEDEKYKWYTFFFGIAGMLMVVALPNKQVSGMPEYNGEINESHNNDISVYNQTKKEQFPTEKRVTRNSVVPSIDENGKLICPSCGTAQNKTNEMCYFCGTKFKIN